MRNRFIKYALISIATLASLTIYSCVFIANVNANINSDRWIPFEGQPAYEQLKSKLDEWEDAPLKEARGNSPRETLLNFYIIMYNIDQSIQELNSLDRFSVSDRAAFSRKLSNTHRFFEHAISSLDLSSIPENTREQKSKELAIKLKEVLDYVFSTRVDLISLPGADELENLNTGVKSNYTSWTLPGSSIHLTNKSADQNQTSVENDFLFSRDTVANIDKMYDDVKGEFYASSIYSSRGFYDSYITKSGFIVEPAFIKTLPIVIQHIFRMPFLGTSVYKFMLLFIITLAAISFHLFSISKILLTLDAGRKRNFWSYDSVAWKRAGIAALNLPVLLYSEWIVIDLIHSTGFYLLFLKTIYNFMLYWSAFMSSILTLEALGCSSGEILVRLSGQSSELQLRRVSNFTMPIFRIISAIVGTIILFRLCITLGLPSNTVLAFSAVPGLAIGLGASKLLGNMFSGLSIQSDRPLKVGEYCSVGEHTGIISRIGLRSIQLDTIDSRVTIPNSLADESLVINYTFPGVVDHEGNGTVAGLMGFDINVGLDIDLPAETISDIVTIVSASLENCDICIQDLFVNIGNKSSANNVLFCSGKVQAAGLESYLQQKEKIMIIVAEAIQIAKDCYICLCVPFNTSREVLDGLSAIVAESFLPNMPIALNSCVFVSIGDCSYEYAIHLSCNFCSYQRSREELGEAKRSLVSTLRKYNVEIALPASVEVEAKMIDYSSLDKA